MLPRAALVPIPGVLGGRRGRRCPRSRPAPGTGAGVGGPSRQYRAKVDDDRMLGDLRALIEQHGWAVRVVAPRVGEEGVPFAYTVGLTAMGHPEIVEQGLPNEVGHQFLNLVGAEVRAGRRFAASSIVRDLAEGDNPVAFIQVEDTSELTAVELVYGVVNALQLVWSDSSGRLPWEPDFGPGAAQQPLLGAWRPT